MILLNAEEGMEYKIAEIETGDRELDRFLLSLGCCRGEEITLVSRMKSGCIINLKDVRYKIDNMLAKAIGIK